MKLWKQVTAKCWTIYTDAPAACEVTTLCRLRCSVASGCALPSAVMFTVVSDWRSNAISVTAKLVRCGLDRRDIDVDLTGGSAGSHWSSIGTGVGSNGLLASMPPSQLTQPHSQDPHAATAAAAAASPDDWRKIVDASCMPESVADSALRGQFRPAGPSRRRLDGETNEYESTGRAPRAGADRGSMGRRKEHEDKFTTESMTATSLLDIKNRQTSSNFSNGRSLSSLFRHAGHETSWIGLPQPSACAQVTLWFHLSCSLLSSILDTGTSSSIRLTSEKTTTLKIGGREELQVPGRPSAHRARINRRRPADGVINDRRHCLRCTFDDVGRQLWVLPSYAASNVGHSPPFLTCAFQISVPDGRTPPRKLPSRTSDPAPNPNTNLTINLTLSSKLT